MSTIDPKMLASEPIAPPAADISIPTDPVELSNRWREMQIIATERPLNSLEVQEMVAITRALRKTNTGPAKAKTPKAKTVKPSISTEDLLGD